MTTQVMMDNFRIVTRHGIGTPLLIVLMLSMMILPLPPIMLDMLFTFNISLAMLVLLATIYALRPLDFAIFPTILLVATLLRLALNIASTRVVLLNGHTGTDAAGQVVKSFGEVVIGGNYTVGIVVFAILVVINFVVVTKGAGRVSEVSARFTLDSMPGKQMAIDADLNAGLINQDEAKIRRREVAQEADFYGSMDGASKFVRGDAVAGILILMINIFGGLFIGVVEHGMSFTDATHNYILLSIGDGLVAQVPALLLSIGAAIIVTRVSAATDMGNEIVKQVIASPKALVITGLILGLLGITPGMPHLAFLTLGGAIVSTGYYIHQREREKLALEAQAPAIPKDVQPVNDENRDLNWDDVRELDTIGLEVGYRLIPMVDKAQGGEVLSRIKGVRKKLSQDLGFLVPSVHIRDNLDLNPNTYRINIAGVIRGEAILYPDKYMAINPGQVFGEVEGITGIDPAFGLPAKWIDQSNKEYAQSLGYTVVDAATVLATHLSHILQKFDQCLVGYEEAQQLLDKLAKSAPKLVESLVPTILPLSTIVRVLQRLLEENVPIKDMRTIAETLTSVGVFTKDLDTLVAHVRIALKNLIVQNIIGNIGEIPVITLQSDLEQLLQNTLSAMGEGEQAIEPTLAERLQQSLGKVVQQQEMTGQPAILIVQPALRPFFVRFIQSVIPSMFVLSYQELPEDKSVRIVGTVG